MTFFALLLGLHDTPSDELRENAKSFFDRRIIALGVHNMATLEDEIMCVKAVFKCLLACYNVYYYIIMDKHFIENT